MTLLAHPGIESFSDRLQDFIRADDSVELFIDQDNLNIIFSIVGKIADSGDVFLVTTDPFNGYPLSLMDFRAVTSMICRSIYSPVDIRIFADSWGVGISSYSGNDTFEGVDPLPLHALEIKLLLAGSASAWMAKEP